MSTSELVAPTETVASLVRAAQQGNRTAFGRLVERYQRAVLGYALRRVGNYAEAQELCQEVFVRALQKLPQLREPECFGGWLRQITHRLAINRRLRHRRAWSTEPQAIEESCVERATPLSKALDRERGRQVRAGLDRLGRIDRETLVAFYVDGQSLIEMSDQFSSPVGTIKRRLHVARKRLAKELDALAAV